MDMKTPSIIYWPY